MAAPQTLKTHLITELKDLLDAEHEHGLAQITPDRERIENRSGDVKLNLQPGVMDICGLEGE